MNNSLLCGIPGEIMLLKEFYFAQNKTRVFLEKKNVS